MFRISEYSIDEVFAVMKAHEGRRGKAALADGTLFRPASQRMQLFYTKGVECVTCGIKGEVFWLETHNQDVTPHLNLYAVNETGDLVLMTKDHVQPKSKGGANELSNYVTMCSPCNKAKADTIVE